MATKSIKFNSVQVLRCLAANCVVLAHLVVVEGKYTVGETLLPARLEVAGPIGVYLFFVISGFVIIQAASRESWRAFLYARVTRIYPIYWIVTSIVLAVWLWRPEMVNASIKGEISIWKSYLLIPQKTPPLLAVGWTLVYEMYFYLAVTIVLAAKFRPMVVLPIWSAAIVIAWLTVAPSHPVLIIVTKPITLLFIFGAFLGLYVQSRKVHRARQPSRFEKLFILLGDASYSTYLLHVLIISALWRFAGLLPWQAPAAFLMVLSIVAANVGGLVSYWYLEKPILRFARRIAGRQDSRPLGPHPG